LRPPASPTCSTCSSSNVPRVGHRPGVAAAGAWLRGRGKPLLLGETFNLYCGGETERRFLLEANRYLVGTFEFFDGRDPNHMAVSTMTDAVYQASCANSSRCARNCSRSRARWRRRTCR
jgi:hypothetical protein